MDNKETLICFIDILEEFDEYKLLPRQKVIRLLNQKITKDPVVLAFVDSSVENGKKLYPEYRINRKTDKLYVWVNPSITETYPYESETICEYIKSKYGSFSEL